MTLGYDPNFIDPDITIALPQPKGALKKSLLRRPGKLREEIYSDHIHFTLVMDKDTRQLMYSAYNLDQNKLIKKVPGNGKRSWRKDGDIGAENQLGNDYYKDRTNREGEKIPNPYDKGHMVMRFNNMWGNTPAQVDKAGKATYTYANASLQHENLNRDEWRELELKIVREFRHGANGKLSIFTGPIYGDLDRHVHPPNKTSARVPSGFFKVICYRTLSDLPKEKLGVLAFAMFQDAKVLRDQRGRSTVKTERGYQVTISDIQNWTGLDFGKQLYTRNPLFYHQLTGTAAGINPNALPERIPINAGDNLVSQASGKRLEIEPLCRRRIIINSAMINPKGDEKRGEWVSLHNRGARKTNIDGWVLADGKGRRATLKGAVESGGSLQLKGAKKGKVMLANTGGSLMLYDDHGCIVDHVTWSGHDVRRLEEGVAMVFPHET